MALPLPTEFLTWASIETLPGVSLLTYFVTLILRGIFSWPAKWLGLVVAIVICELFTLYHGLGARDYVLALVNGFLAFLTAGGGVGFIGSFNGGKTYAAQNGSNFKQGPLSP